LFKIITIHVLAGLRQLGVLLSTLALLLSQFPPVSFAQETITFAENKIKVSFIYNFAKFINWPEEKTSNKNFSICTLGGESLYSSLDYLSKTKKINSKTILIRENPSLNKLKTCNILFVGSSESERLNSILRKLKGFPVLTIGDTEGYEWRGVGINLCKVNKNLRFKINNKVLLNSGLTASSELLKLGIPIGFKN
jgi:hypothetical protein